MMSPAQETITAGRYLERNQQASQKETSKQSRLNAGDPGENMRIRG
jgi:hypothetical protein